VVLVVVVIVTVTVTMTIAMTMTVTFLSTILITTPSPEGFDLLDPSTGNDAIFESIEPI
jgi:hypothetical protein